MPGIDSYSLDNCGLDGPSSDSNTRNRIVASSSNNTVASANTNLLAYPQFSIAPIKNFLDVYSLEPALNISVVGSHLIYFNFSASSSFLFQSSMYVETSFILTDDKGINFPFFSSINYGSDITMTPAFNLRLYSLSIDKQAGKLYYTGTGTTGSYNSLVTVNIPTNLNLDGELTFKVGVRKNHTAGGNHNVLIEKRSLTVLTS